MLESVGCVEALLRDMMKDMAWWFAQYKDGAASE